MIAKTKFNMKFDIIMPPIKRWRVKKLQIPNGLLVAKNHQGFNYNPKPPIQ
jgi:hypothetical protein